MTSPTTLSPGLLSYPGITAEVIPQVDKPTNKAYEAVLNCGGAFLAPRPIQLPLMLERANRLRAAGVDAVVLAGDRGVLSSETLLSVKEGVSDVFEGRMFQLPIDRASAANNTFGLQVVRSLADSSVVRELMEKAPNALAITSVPYSDPTNVGAGKIAGTLLEKSLSLFAINNRTIPTELAKEFVGSLGSIDLTNSKDPLVQLFDENPSRPLVFKNNGQCAGGTSTQIVGQFQRAEFLQKSEATVYEVYDFFEPSLVAFDNGRYTPSQIRPFVIDGELFGFSLKMPASSIGECVDPQTGVFMIPKSGLRSLNDKLNSSSGKSVSLFFDKNGVFIAGTRGMNETLTIRDVEQMNLNGRGKLSCPEFTRRVALNCIPLVNTIQQRVNSYVGTTSLQ